ncbi:TM2 domain-containing protein [Flavobacterium faecale]|uniref:TM2 domain-containing protein n=1 Tax=Flavobacterium faecale TaxID=1355330 RepID=UPI003AAD11A6
MENSSHMHWNDPHSYEEDSKRLAAGILAIVLAPFGVHKFLLGYVKEGIIWLIMSAVTMGMLTGFLGIMEGFLYLSKSDEEFYDTYQLHTKKWF